MDRPRDAANAASRRRLADLFDRLEAGDYGRDLGDGWTVGAALAHVPFWDRSCLARWERYGRDGAVEAFPDVPIDVVNAAGLPAWRALDAAAAALAWAAVGELDGPIAGLPDAAVAHARETGRAFLVERAGRRDAHIAQIRAVLDGA